MLRGSFRKISRGKVQSFTRVFFGCATLKIVLGGSLGWKVRLVYLKEEPINSLMGYGRGSLHGDFEKVAYGLEPSTTSNPKYAEVKTSHGYHIVMVEGRK